MKKLFLILPILMMGCAELSQVSTSSAPVKTVLNDKCEEIQKYKVFQVMSDGTALASACDSKYGVETCYGMTVFVPVQKNETLYDDKIIQPADDQCIIYDGVYKYESKGAGNKTVPKLKIANKKITNPAYTEWLKEQESN